MLTQLTITNFAIIEELEINFKDGLIVLTGETGAGKSIIVDALGFLLGARASTDLIKTGTNKACVEGNFILGAIHELPLVLWFKENGFDISENNILSISRELTNQGSKVRINGSLANVTHLSFLREYLLDIHEQSEHIELLKTEKQLEIIDDYSDVSHKKLLERYKKAFEEYQLLKNKLNNYLANSEQIAKKLDFLKFQVKEIKSANIKDLDEEENLIAKRQILLNKKELQENTDLIYELLNGENPNNLISNLSQIKKLITGSSEHDKSFEPYLEIIENITSEAKELSSFVKNYNESIGQEENNLNEIEERLDLFYSLKRKYGRSLAEIQEHLQKIENELRESEGAGASQEEIEKAFKQKEKETNDLAEKLTKSREKITKDFVNRVHEELLTLGFNPVEVLHATPLLVVEFTPCDLLPNGKEQIQFLFTANPDEPPKPLLKVISGGELSRVMLAIKSVTCRGIACHTPTMVFDEIDIGVSGEIAASVARKLYKISRNNQLICITHQPIIASMADSHFVIEKKITGGTTQIFIKEVAKEEKAEALASLLTPDKYGKAGVTEDAREFAKSLLENARKIKEKELVTT